MKTNILKLATFLLILAGSFSSCGKNKALTPPASQKILFECYYINRAWGYSHRGFFIDNEGKVLDYSQSGSGVNNTAWNFPDDQGMISEQALMENLQKTTVRDTLINKKTLEEYADIIYLVDENSYTERHNAYDMGARIYTCYQYNKDTRTYKQVKVSENGDWIRINNNKYAKQISDWLQTIR
jgi:hypothetical protein